MLMMSLGWKPVCHLAGSLLMTMMMRMLTADTAKCTADTAKCTADTAKCTGGGDDDDGGDDDGDDTGSRDDEDNAPSLAGSPY